MKSLKQLVLASALVLSTAGIAAAGQYQTIPGVTGVVRVVVDNGVATLSGQLDSSFERQLAVRYVSRTEGVNKVINNLVSFK